MAIEHVVNSEKKLSFFISNAKSDFEKHKYIRYQISYTPRRQNSWSMKKTWRMWMSETAAFMAARGVTMPLYIRPNGQGFGSRPFSPTDAHELFVSQYLGIDESGERYRTASGDKGKMLAMMEKHVAWCVDRGCKLTIPSDCEYQKEINEACS